MIFMCLTYNMKYFINIFSDVFGTRFIRIRYGLKTFCSAVEEQQ